MKKALRIVLTVLPILYMIGIWILSGIPTNAIIELPSSSVDRFIKEAMHLIEFAILYMLIVAALAVNQKLTVGTSLLAAIIASLYGIVDEIHQVFIPYRSAEIIDVIKNMIGVLAAYFHVQFHHFKRRKSTITFIEKFGKDK